MQNAPQKSIQVHVTPEDFETASAYVESLLKRSDVSKDVAMQTMLVFEAVFHELGEQGFDQDTTLNISPETTLGNIDIKIKFTGHMFLPVEHDEDSPETLLLEALSDKIEHRYSSGVNVIKISVRRNLQRYIFLNMVVIVLAAATYAVLDSFLDTQGKKSLLIDYVIPIETLFANAMLMIGAPVTFFSLTKNLTDAYIVSEKNGHAKSLRIKTFITSIVAIVLAFVAGFFIVAFVNSVQSLHLSYTAHSIEWSFAAIASDLVPSSIIEPFVTISPFPIIVIALLLTYALCNAVKYFTMVKMALDACYELFGHMLRAIMVALPFFCFVAFLDILLSNGFIGLVNQLALFFLMFLNLSILMLSYAIRLRAHGIAIVPFVKKLVPLVAENFKIGSVIDAVPFNVRYCSKHFGLNRKTLKDDLTITAQINLDGNCYLTMLVMLTYLMISNMDIPWVNIVGIALLVLFLSLGAPNQPGSLLIGVLIILMYLDSFELLSLAICMEVFFGGIQNIINVIGNIVLAVIEGKASRQP